MRQERGRRKRKENEKGDEKETSRNGSQMENENETSKTGRWNESNHKGESKEWDACLKKHTDTIEYNNMQYSFNR